MLDRMLVTLMEGAVICLGVPFLLKLCTNLFGAWIIEFMKLHFWKCEVSDKVLRKKPAEDLVETKQVIRTDAVRCIELQSQSTLSALLIQKHCGFVTDHTSDMQHMLCQSFMNKAKSKNLRMENCASILMHSLKNSEPENMALFPYSKLKGLYHHFKQDSMFSADVREKHCWNLKKLSHCTLKDKYLENCEIVMEQDFKVQPFENFPSDTSNMNELISVSDCVYNKKGQLVRMFVCFITEHSDASSDVSSSDSDYSTQWEIDCEDFIVFDNSCTDENDCCTRLDFVCKAGNLPKESCEESLVLTSNLYCEIAMMKSCNSKLDSFVQEILHPNLRYGCDEHILMNQDVECKSSEDSQASTTCKTVSKKRKKKVHFKPDNELAIVYPMVVWNFAYKQARKGTWEADALDRLRFQKRIKELDQILTPVLLAKKEKVI